MKIITNLFLGNRKLWLCLMAVSLSGLVLGQTQTETFNYTGAVQTWTVPNGITSVTIEAWGAQGNTNSDGEVDGGLGGYATGELAVSPGEMLYIYVGGGGIQSTAGGFNGGGEAGTVGCAESLGGGGGGASDVRQGADALANRAIVAAGGGGAGGNRNQGCGRGTGGGGGSGYYGGGGGAAWPFASTALPTGGTQSAGGAGGTSTYTVAPNNEGEDGVVGQGGDGGDEINSNQGGSGTAQPGGSGGGLTGSDGLYQVNWTGQSGAGGSSYIGGVTNGTTLAGERSGNGLVTITYLLDPCATGGTVGLNGLPCGFFVEPGHIDCGSSSASYYEANNTFTINSVNCHYVNPFTSDQAANVAYQLCGDGEITTQVQSISGYGWAGVMMRESHAAGSKKVSLAYNGSNFGRREIRTQTNGPAYPQQFPSFGKSWLKLVRQGFQVRGYMSPNGLFWQLVMVSNIQMNSCVEVSLFVTNVHTPSTVTAVFGNTEVIDGNNQPLVDNPSEWNAPIGQAAINVESYPNPTAAEVTIDLGKLSEEDIQGQVFDAFGQQVSPSYRWPAGTYNPTIDLSDLPSGTYYLRIQQGEELVHVETLVRS